MGRARQARSVETRARLLAAARTVIAEYGVEGASVDAIAERADRTSGSLYGQFGSKGGLLVELLDESKDLVAERMLVDIEAAATLDDRLAALWRNFAEPPRAARDWVQVEHEVWVWATRAGNDRARRRLGRRYAVEFASLGAALAEWAAEGLIDPPGPVDQVARVVVSTLLGLEMSYRLDPAAVDEPMVVAALRRLVGAPVGAPVAVRRRRTRRRPRPRSPGTVMWLTEIDASAGPPHGRRRPVARTSPRAGSRSTARSAAAVGLRERREGGPGWPK